MRVENAITLAQALLKAEYVSQAVAEERRAICETCEHALHRAGTIHCGLCGCKCKGGPSLLNLTAHVESLPKWGCKHPKRADGKGWAR